MSYTFLIPAIEDVLETVSAVKAIYPYPLSGTPKAYPAVIYQPDNFENDISTTRDNMKVFRFKMWVAASVGNTTEEAVFTSVLPNVVDKITDAFDAAWSGGTLEGHRIWQVISSGQWGMSIENEAKVAYAELTLTVKMATSV